MSEERKKLLKTVRSWYSCLPVKVLGCNKILGSQIAKVEKLIMQASSEKEESSKWHSALEPLAGC